MLKAAASEVLKPPADSDRRMAASSQLCNHGAVQMVMDGSAFESGSVLLLDATLNNTAASKAHK